MGAGVGVRVGRGRLLAVGVAVTKRLGVDVSEGKGVGWRVFVGARVWVGTNAVTTCSVSAAAVSKLETAKSRTFRGWIVITGK